MSSLPICCETVVAWREGLLGLAEALAGPEPLNPCGVARTLALVTDGSGPLFNPAPKRPMSEVLWWIADGLQPCPPHVWGCPKVMKVDPEHVAWTCERCGAIALTSDPSVRPA
jgi:hypothetical protein